jgi:hypothetical protein
MSTHRHARELQGRVVHQGSRLITIHRRLGKRGREVSFAKFPPEPTSSALQSVTNIPTCLMSMCIALQTADHAHRKKSKPARGVAVGQPRVIQRSLQRELTAGSTRS